jgi:hypothetical protein
MNYKKSAIIRNAKSVISLKDRIISEYGKLDSEIKETIVFANRNLFVIGNDICFQQPDGTIQIVGSMKTQIEVSQIEDDFSKNEFTVRVTIHAII